MLNNTYNLQLREAAKKKCRKLRQSQTNAEKIFWDKVRNRRLNGLKFIRQFPIFYENNNTESFFIADFYCSEKKVIIEIDGIIHRFNRENDQIRTEILNSLGIRVIRLYNEEIENESPLQHRSRWQTNP